MVIGGFQKFSLIDYPGKMCALIYTRGCNFRCPYCHNPELVWPEKYGAEVGLASVLEFLRSRQGLLEAVTITGGEPTLHNDLADVVRVLKKRGFLVKLDTNGSRPAVLRELLHEGLLDYVAMDIKAPLEKYQKVCISDIDVSRLEESIQLLLCGEVSCEFRTTVDRSLLDEEDLLKIGAAIRGADRFYLQKLNRHNLKVEKSGKMLLDDDLWLRQVADQLKDYVVDCGVR